MKNKNNKINKEDQIIIDALIADDKNLMRQQNRNSGFNSSNRINNYYNNFGENNYGSNFQNDNYRKNFRSNYQCNNFNDILNLNRDEKQELTNKVNKLTREKNMQEYKNRMLNKENDKYKEDIKELSDQINYQNKINSNLLKKIDDYEKEKKDKERKKIIENEKFNSIMDKLTNEYINNLGSDFDCDLQAYKNKLSPHIDNLIQNFFSQENNFFSKFFFNEMKNHINSENLSGDNYAKLVYINILILGGIGKGKSTLVNSVLKLDESQGAKTGVGNSVTKETKGYTSNKEPCLRVYDTKGFEHDDNYEKEMKQFEEFIQKPINEGNFKDIIHCIWYCVNNRFNKYEIEGLKKFQEKYPEKALPIIIVITQDMSQKEEKEMEFAVKRLLREGKLIADVVRVIAKEYEKEVIRKDSDSDSENEDKRKNKEEKFVIPKKGIKNLIDKTKENILNAIESACFNSFIKKINSRNKENVNQKTDSIRRATEYFFTNQKIDNLNRNNYNKIMKLIGKILDNFFKEKKFTYRTMLLFEQYIKVSENIFNKVFDDSFKEFCERNSLNLVAKQLDRQTSLAQTFQSKIENKDSSQLHQMNSELISTKYYASFKIIFFNYFIKETILFLIEKTENRIILEYDNLEKNQELRKISLKKIQNLINDFANKIYKEN